MTPLDAAVMAAYLWHWYVPLGLAITLAIGWAASLVSPATP